jgi:glycosyltransferase involved in cell wall biosynthesis
MNCLVYLPHSYTGRGPAESCIRIVEHFAEQGLAPEVFVHRARAPIPASVRVVEAGGGLLRRLPFRVVAPFTRLRLQRLFMRAVDKAAPGTIAYFWPDSPTPLVEHAKRRGLICVREMINNPLVRAKPILDSAYLAAGLEPAHAITAASVERENDELALYDYIFSSNAEVDASLRAMGIPEDRILCSSFGWTSGRFAAGGVEGSNREDRPFRAVFVGLMNVRKGIPTLLEAWEQAGIDGELVLAGTPEPCLVPMIEAACQSPGVRHLGHVADVASLYRSSDVFVFPTYEEGGPQVTYEAAACGLPILTTTMGAARLVDHDRTGLVVRAGDAASLAAALRRFADDTALRQRLAEAASSDVSQFEYREVGRQRALLLREQALASSKAA